MHVAWGNYNTRSLNGTEPQDPCTKGAQCEGGTDSVLKPQGSKSIHEFIYFILIFPTVLSVRTLCHRHSLIAAGGDIRVIEEFK